MYEKKNTAKGYESSRKLHRHTLSCLRAEIQKCDENDYYRTRNVHTLKYFSLTKMAISTFEVFAPIL